VKAGGEATAMRESARHTNLKSEYLPAEPHHATACSNRGGAFTSSQK
jgi:hypothetical protein